MLSVQPVRHQSARSPWHSVSLASTLHHGLRWVHVAMDGDGKYELRVGRSWNAAGGWLAPHADTTRSIIAVSSLAPAQRSPHPQPFPPLWGEGRKSAGSGDELGVVSSPHVEPVVRIDTYQASGANHPAESFVFPSPHRRLSTKAIMEHQIHENWPCFSLPPQRGEG